MKSNTEKKPYKLITNIFRNKNLENEKMNITKKKIIWAVDPFAKEQALQRSTALAIRAITQRQTAIIEPVYFFSAYFANIPTLKVPEKLLHEMRKAGQARLNKILNGVELRGIKPLHILSHPNIWLKEGATLITKIAKAWKADLIVVSTRAQRGLKRFTLGSFAETLILNSDFPLLVVNPLWKSKNKLDHILFATDFSDESKTAFSEVLKLAKSLSCGVTLFHKVKMDSGTLFQPAFGFDLLYAEAFAYAKDHAHILGKKWAKEAERMHVPVTVAIDQRWGRSVEDAIFLAMKNKSGIIAMASHSGAFETVLIGSTTRKILRESRFRVWVIHPDPRQVNATQDPLVVVEESDIYSNLSHAPRVKRIA